MFNLSKAVLILVTTATLGACQYNSPEQKAEARAAGQARWEAGPDLSNADVDKAASMSASQRDEWRLSADLAERSYKQKPDIINEFNLATGYQRTGRPELAIPLYIDLVERGQFTPTVPLPKEDGKFPSNGMAPTVSEESNIRLVKMGVDSEMLKSRRENALVLK